MSQNRFGEWLSATMLYRRAGQRAMSSLLSSIFVSLAWLATRVRIPIAGAEEGRSKQSTVLSTVNGP